MVYYFKMKNKKKIWKYDSALWCVDFIEQMIYGGQWLQVQLNTISTLYSLKIDDNDDFYFINIDDDKKKNKELGPSIDALLLTDVKIRYYIPNIGILKHRWHESQIIQQGLSHVLQTLKNINIYDKDGLRIIENDHPALIIFENIIKKYHCEYSNAIRRAYSHALLWKNIPILSSYNDIMLQSRQALRVLWRWYAYETKQKSQYNFALDNRVNSNNDTNENAISNKLLSKKKENLKQVMKLLNI